MIEILILDFNRPTELKSLLLSLKEKALFDKKVVVLNNGGDRYADKFLEEGLCDKVINNRVGIGCGGGSVQLFAQCESEFAFYVQVDHELQLILEKKHIDHFKNAIQEGDLYVDVAGDQGQGKFSERPFFIKKSDYLKIPISFGGPGPLEDLKWSEESIQDYMEKENCFFYSYHETHLGVYPPFKDCGWSSVRENPDGSRWHHQPDTKVLKCLKPPKETFTFPPLNEEEWNIAIAGQWPTLGKIPKEWEAHSFEYWNKL